jgi:hypothetical protein
MDFRNNHIMLMVIAGLSVTLATVLGFRAAFLPKFRAQPRVIQPQHAIPVRANKKVTYVETGIQNSPEVNKVYADEAVLFTLKTACRDIVSRINTNVEIWYVMKSEWPKENLNDIGRDVDYFPNGIPPCPLDGTRYTLDPKTHRIAGHLHSNIKVPEVLNDIRNEQNRRNMELQPLTIEPERSKR